jgi:hypothetical protein
MFAMVFKCFLGVFTNVSYAYFKCLICLLLYVATDATDASGCFKSRLGIAHGMCVRSGRQHGRHLRRRGTTTGVLPREPDVLDARSLPVRAASRRASKSVLSV